MTPPSPDGDPDQDAREGAERAPSRLPAPVARCLVDLAVALNRFSMYPQGHPALAPAADEVLDALRVLLREQGSISVEGRRERVVVGEAASDPGTPHLRALAARLHDHHLARLTFLAGLEGDELASFLRAMSTEPSRGGEPLGLRSEGVRSWPHIRMEPQRYDPLRLDEEGRDRLDVDPSGGAAGPDPTSAARAGVASPGEAPPGAVTAAPLGSRIGAGDLMADAPEDVARRLEEDLGAEDADRIVAFQIMRLAERLSEARGQQAELLRRRMSRMILRLQPETLAYLLEFGDEGRRDEDLLFSAAGSLSVEAALRLVRAAAARHDEGIEAWLLRVVNKLAMYAGPRERRADGPGGSGAAAASPESAERVHDLVDRIVDDWKLEDPRPTLYRSTLRRMARTGPSEGRRPTAQLRIEPERFVQMGLEMDEPARDVDGAVVTLLEERRVPELIEMAEAVPEPNRAAEALWNRLAVPETVEGLLHEPNPDFELLRRVVERAGAAVAGPLLDALSDSNAGSRAYWHNVFGLLLQIGEPVADLVPERLEDEHWFVRRNLLALLYELPRRPEGFTALPYLEESEPRVRAEALRLALEEPAGREPALAAGLLDDNERVVGLALSAATEELPGSLEPLVIRRASDGSLAPALRSRAVRILAERPSRSALRALVDIVWARRWLFWRRLAEPSGPVLAALEALSRRWADAAEARPALEAARSSDDERVREAVAASPARGHGDGNGRRPRGEGDG